MSAESQTISAGRMAGVLLACVVVIVLCVFFVDRPAAIVATHFFWKARHLRVPLDSLLLLIPLGALSILVAGLTTMLGKSISHRAETLVLAGFSLMWATACNFFLLQPAFGRSSPVQFLIHHDDYRFAWLQGHGGTGLPSGHAVIAASYLMTIWFRHPRTRIAVGSIIAAVMIGLVLAEWHFVSDTLAGLLEGTLAAAITVRLWERRA